MDQKNFLGLTIILNIHVSHISPFLANVPISYPLETPENQGFLVFSEGIKWEHRPEIG